MTETGLQHFQIKKDNVVLTEGMHIWLPAILNMAWVSLTASAA